MILVVALLAPSLIARLAAPGRRVRTFDAGQSNHANAPKARNRVRIVCYNIAHGRGTATSNWEGGSKALRKTRLDKIAEALAGINADTVVLNEVDFDCSWSHGVNQAEYLAKQAGYRYRVEQSNLDGRVLLWRWRFGNAILSKHPLIAAEVVDLPAYSSWESAVVGKKRAVKVTAEHDAGAFCLIAAHLSHRSEDTRTQSTEKISKLVELEEFPTVVAGDLNSTPTGTSDSVKDRRGRNTIDVVDESGHFQRFPIEADSSPANLTYHSQQPRVMIDWILVPVCASNPSWDVIDVAWSDHRPVCCNFDLSKRIQKEVRKDQPKNR